MFLTEEVAVSVYGFSLDLGSSTLVLRLVDLTTGDPVDEISFNNPQIEIGADILTRIHFAGREGGLSELQSLVLDEINRRIRELLGENRVSAKKPLWGWPLPATPP
jgi:uncharacterized 2Fe-2S/4Fe-4S cluster protein (DUF4445 family)